MRRMTSSASRRAGMGIGTPPQGAVRAENFGAGAGAAAP